MLKVGGFARARAAQKDDTLVTPCVNHFLVRSLRRRIDVRRQIVRLAPMEHGCDLIRNILGYSKYHKIIVITDYLLCPSTTTAEPSD